MVRFHCSWALLTALVVPALAVPAKAAAQPAPGAVTSGYVVFVGGTPIGREDVIVERTAEHLTITGRERLGAPLDVIVRHAEVKYKADWTPVSLVIDAQLRGRLVNLKASFDGTAATVDTNDQGTVTTKTVTVSPKPVMVPNLFFGAYEALAQRLVNAQAGASLFAYVVPDAELPVRVVSVENDRVQTGRTVLDLRRHTVALPSAGGELLMQITSDADGHLVRLTVPGQGLDIVRDDVAASSSRMLTHSNPTDEPITIPAEGFNIAGTLTRPGKPLAKNPAVVLLAGSNVTDRDSVVAGVAIMSQLAGALADAGYMVLRFDKRGTGQSGGRGESATISDFANDARLALRWLSSRKDVDEKRIALVGHSEGAAVALVTASRDGRVAAVASIAGPASTGVELNLEQQSHALDLVKATPEERQQKVELQKAIQAAVLTGTGWDRIPRQYKSADTPWFQSYLQYDPAKPLKDVDRPLLILHGELDQQVPVAHADRLGALAKKVSKSKAIDVVTVKGVNHLLVPATTGEVTEYGTLADRNVSKDIVKSLTDWLGKTLVSK
ncbi:MAG: alpha/beta fold hydrolase [Vicinamibacterales bacterium]